VFRWVAWGGRVYIACGRVNKVGVVSRPSRTCSAGRSPRSPAAFSATKTKFC
jgi:hypothetical protein